MAYTGPPAVGDGDVYPFGNWNTYVKANWEASCVHAVTTAGDITYATGNQAVTRLAFPTGYDSILVGEVGDGAPKWHITPNCHLHKSTDQAIGAAAWTSIDFADGDSTQNDPDDMHDGSGADSAKIIIPANGAGFYTFGGCATFDASPDNTNNWAFGVRVLLGGATTLVIHQQAYEFLLDGRDISLSICGMTELAATNELEFQVYTSVACDVVSTSPFTPIFWASWQRMAS